MLCMTFIFRPLHPSHRWLSVRTQTGNQPPTTGRVFLLHNGSWSTGSCSERHGSTRTNQQQTKRTCSGWKNTTAAADSDTRASRSEAGIIFRMFWCAIKERTKKWEKVQSLSMICGFMLNIYTKLRNSPSPEKQYLPMVRQAFLFTGTGSLVWTQLLVTTHRAYAWTDWILHQSWLW